MVRGILLIDDDYATNEYHKIILERANICENLFVYRYAGKALEWLKSIDGKDFPELILLDINMPRMDGFEFLDEYEKEFTDSSSAIIMLSTSINSSDKEKSKNYNIKAFVNKPLTVDVLRVIVGKFGEKSKI